MAASSLTNQRSLRHRQRQRIAARDDHVADFAVLADVLDHPLVVVAGGVPAVAVHGHPLARAEPAIHGADVRGDQQHAVGIAVRQAGDRRVLVLFERVFQLDAGGARLLQAARGATAGRSGRADRRRRSARSNTAGSPACTSLRDFPGRQIPGGRREKTRPVERLCEWHFASANASRPTVRRGRRSISGGGEAYQEAPRSPPAANCSRAPQWKRLRNDSCSANPSTAKIHRARRPGSPGRISLNSRAYTSYRQNRQAGSGTQPAFFSLAENYSRAAAKRQVARPRRDQEIRELVRRRASSRHTPPPSNPRSSHANRLPEPSGVHYDRVRTRREAQRFLATRPRRLKSDL